MKVVLWGDDLGIRHAVEVVGVSRLAGLVGASRRPADLPGLEQQARALSVPLLVQPPGREVEAYRAFRQLLLRLGADLFLVNSYSMILRPDVLNIPALGAVNVHGAPLPEYRGANALNWVLINGEAETALTIHYMDAGVDTGDILVQQRVPIAHEDTALSLRGKLTAVLPSLLQRALVALEAGNAPRTPQDATRAHSWPRRRPEDGRIDWRWPAERIYNLIRALVKPWPGAFYDTPAGERVVLDEFVPLPAVRALKLRHQQAA